MAVGIQCREEHQASYDDALLWSVRPHVFVAGGLSFLGRNLIPALVQAGYGVRSLARSIDERAQLRSLGCSTVGHGEAYSFEAVKCAARGCLYAVHCASAFVHFDVSENDIVFKSNNLVTSNIIRACRALRILKLVLQSSEAVLFDGCALRGVDEAYPLPVYPLGSCARSMQDVEQLVLSANSACLQTIVIRPRLLWGRDDELFLPSLLDNCKSGNLRLVGGGKYLTSTCHVSNACEGIICALKAAKGGEVFFLTDGRPVVFAEFVRRLLTASGVQNVEGALSRSIPLWLARRLAMVAEMLGKRLNSTPRMTQSGIGLIGQEMTFLDAKARDLVGYKSSKTMEEGFKEIHLNYVRDKAKNDLGQE